MDANQRLDQLAEQYRARGYQVVLHPEQSQLPDFAQNFKVEMLAKRSDESALVSVKKTIREVEADGAIAGYAEATESEKGWRFDLVVLGPDQPTQNWDRRQAAEPTDDELNRWIESVTRLLDSNGNEQALVLAWSVLEAAMRRRLRADGEDAGWGTSARTMLNELLSAGVFNHSAFRELEGYSQLRNALVHGFTAPVIERAAVEFVLGEARRLLEVPKKVKQPA